MKSKNDDLTSREAKGGVLNDHEIDGFGEWLSNAYSFKGDGNFTRWNMEVAYAAGMERAAKQAAEPVGMRDSFESWYIKEHTLPDSPPIEMPRRPDGRYGVPMRDISWIAWQAAFQEAAQPMGESREFVLRAMAMNYSEAHSWDHLDADACRRGADEIKSLRAALTAQPHASVVNLGEVVHVEARRCDVCDHIGVNDASETQGACHNCDWQGDEPKEDLCPGCGDTSCMAAACPECGGRYSLVASTEIAAQPHAEAKVDKTDRVAVSRAIDGLKDRLFDVNALDAEAVALHSAGRDAFFRIVAAPEVPDV